MKKLLLLYKSKTNEPDTYTFRIKIEYENNYLFKALTAVDVIEILLEVGKRSRDLLNDEGWVEDEG